MAVGVVKLEKGDRCYFLTPPKVGVLSWVNWTRRHGDKVFFVRNGKETRWRIPEDFIGEVRQFIEQMLWVIEGEPSKHQEKGGYQNGHQAKESGGGFYSRSASATVRKSQADPWSVLFVTKDAPQEVVLAAYKALVFMNHPDRGGDEERIKEINTAKDAIFKLRCW